MFQQRRTFALISARIVHADLNRRSQTHSGPPASLKRAVGYSGFFTLAFGAMVGSGWVVVLGDWLRQGGPVASICGFLLGAGVMVLVSLCYGELAARFPTAGGEFLYTLHTFGPFAAFLVGWFLTLAMVSTCAFEGIALAWLVRVLIPTVALPTAYTVAGFAVTWDALIIGLCAAVIVALLHLRGAGSAIRFQNIVTYAFIAVSIALIASGFAFGSTANLRPLFQVPHGSPLLGLLWTFATSAFFLNGWQASLHAMEERSEGVAIPRAVRCIVLAIAAAAAFYAGIILAASMAAPWQGLISRELPAAAAFTALGARGFFGSAVLVAAIVSISKTWSATAWIATRLLFAQSRHGLLPPFLSAVDPAFRTPRNAILFVTALSLVGIALGRSAVVPIVDTLSICTALAIIVCLLVLVRRRAFEPDQPAFTVPGGKLTIYAALISATCMVGVALIQPLMATGHIPVEWFLLLAWGCVGAAVVRGRLRLRMLPRRSTIPESNSNES